MPDISNLTKYDTLGVPVYLNGCRDLDFRSLHDIKTTRMGGQIRFKAEVDFDGKEITRAYLYKQDLDLLLTVGVHACHVCKRAHIYVVLDVWNEQQTFSIMMMMVVEIGGVHIFVLSTAIAELKGILYCLVHCDHCVERDSLLSCPQRSLC